MKKKAGIFKTILVVALIALMLVVGFVSAKYVQNNTIGSFDLAIEKAYTYNLIDGPSFNSIFYNKASNAESVTFCSKAELDQSIFDDLTLTHVGATENDGIFLGVSTDGKTAYVIADSKDPNQKIIANSDCSMMFSNMIVDLGGRPLKAIDLSGLDTSNTTNMSSMFSGCTGLIDLDLSGLDTTNVTDMSSMFDSCNSLPDLDLSGFDTTNVTDMSGMFNSCNSLTDLDLSGFNTANVTNMEVMFQSCGSLTTIYASDKFTVDKVTNSTAMFFGCSNLVGGKGTAYDASHIDKSYAHIDGGMNNPGYFTDKNAPATTYNLIDGPSFNRTLTNKASNAESLTFCSKVELDQTVFNDLTLTHVGVSENDAVFLGVSSDGKTAYVFADSSNPNQKVVANENCSMMFRKEMMPVVPGEDDFSNSLETIDLSGLNTVNVTNMSSMFESRQNLKVNLSEINTTNVEDMSFMFFNCSFDDLNLSGFNTANVTNMNSMFRGCIIRTTLDLSGFNTANVEDMSYMFMECPVTILDLSGFDTTNVKYMTYMFYDCGKLQTIYASESFVVEKVVDPNNSMFVYCLELVGGKGTVYDRYYTGTSYAHIDGGMSNPGYFTDKNVPAATYNLIDGYSFNSTLKNKASAVENVTFCSKANLDESTIGDLTLTHIGATENDAVYLGVSSDGKTAYVFANSLDPNQKVIANEDCSNMFSSIYSITSIDLTGLNTSNTVYMTSFFENDMKLKSIEFGNIDTSNVIDMYHLFAYCYSLTSLDISDIDFANVRDMGGMFAFCSGLTELDLSNFYTNSAVNMTQMFAGCSGLKTLDLSTFNTQNAINTNMMFAYCSNLKTIYTTENFITGNITDSGNMFNGCSSLIGGKETVYNKSHIDKSYAHIDGGIANPGYFTDKNAPATTYNLVDGYSFSSALLTKASYIGNIIFCSKANLDEATIDDLTLTHVGATQNDAVYLGVPSDRKKVYVIADSNDPNQKIMANSDSSYMFYEYGHVNQNITNIDLSGLDTSNVTDMTKMFYSCQDLTDLDLSGFDTSNVTNMSGMFIYCNALTGLDLSSFDTSNVTNMDSMFFDCSGLKTLNVSSFNTSNVTNMESMFGNCSGLKTLNVSSFDTSNVTNMSSMFIGCSGLTNLDVSSFNTAKVTIMTSMFYNCSSLTTIFASNKFTVNKVTESNHMFYNCSNLVGGKGTVYRSSRTDKTYAHIDGGTSNPGYFTEKNSRATTLSDYNANNLNSFIEQDNTTIIDAPVLLTWTNTLMTWGEKKELKAVINDIDNTDGLQTVMTIENEVGDQVQEPITLTAKNNEWTVLIDTFAFTEGVYKATVSEMTDPSGERKFTGGFVSSSCAIRISPCQISFSDTSKTIDYGTNETINGTISGLPDGELPDCFNLIKVNLVDSYGEITQVSMQIIREEDQTVYRFDIPNNLKAGVYNAYVNLKEVNGYVIGPNDSLEFNIGTIIISSNTNNLTSLPTETNETNKAEDPGLEPVA